MTVYIVLYACVFLFAALDVFATRREMAVYINKNALVLISFLLFFAVSAFRYRTGYDYSGYEEMLINALTKEDTYREPLYTALNKLFRHFTSDFYVMQFFICAFTSAAFYWFMNKYSPSLFLSVCFYVCSLYLTLNLGFVRQCIAIAFCLIAADRFIQRKTGQFVVFVTLAILFHYSALLFVPVVFINRKKYSRIMTLCLLVTSIALFSNYTLFKTIMMTIVDAPFVPLPGKVRNMVHVNLENATFSFGFLGWFPRRLLIWFVLLFRAPKNQREIIFYKIVVLGLLFETMGFRVIVAQRASYPFLIAGESVLFAYFFQFMREKRYLKRLFYNAAALFLLYLFVWGPVNFMVIKTNAVEMYRYEPYYSVFFRNEYRAHIKP
jgi:hypothetical protein